MDTFYIAQIAAGSYNSSDQLEREVPTIDEFESFCSQHRELVGQDAWRQYYPPSFLAQEAPARFYRLPNLRDLPDSNDPLANPRNKGVGHFAKLPRWALCRAPPDETQGRTPGLSGWPTSATIADDWTAGGSRSTRRWRMEYHGEATNQQLPRRPAVILPALDGAIRAYHPLPSLRRRWACEQGRLAMSLRGSVHEIRRPAVMTLSPSRRIILAVLCLPLSCLSLPLPGHSS